MKVRSILLPALMLAASCTMAVAQDVPGVTKDTIKIGVIGPMTGPAAIFGKSVFGVEALYKKVNDEGGINGRKIEIFREDDGCDPARGLAAVKKLISQDNVFAINGIACSGVAMAVKQDIVKTDVPLMIMSAATDALSAPTVANVFQAVPTTNVVGKTMIDFAMSKAGTDKIAFVSHSDDWGKSNREPAIAELKDKYGKAPVLNMTMERGSNDATPQILQIRNSGAQFVVLMMYPAEVAIFVRDAAKYGLNIPILCPMSISLEDTRDRAGGPSAVKNLYVFYPYVGAFDSPEMKTWTDLIKKYYPNERIENFSFLGMGSTATVIEALKKVGPDLTRAKFMDALNQTTNFDTGVLSAPITLTPQDHAGVKGGAMATFRDGKVVVLKSWQ
jgi:branched-chain amino acid transport system substrate-binding protein